MAFSRSGIGGRAPRRRFRRRLGSDFVPALLFIGPWILGYLAFQLYPLLASLYYSFTAYDIAARPIFIGLENYVRLFTQDTLFRTALFHSLVFAAVSVPLNLTFALFVALLLNRHIPGRGILRAAYFLPSVVPSVANAMVWVMLLRSKGGLVNVVLGWFHIPPPNWLYDPHWALAALIFVNMWAIGPPIVIFLAALQNVPRHLYEAARVDGAKPRHQLRHVTIPMLSPVILFNMIIGIIGAFQVFALPYVIFGFVGSGTGGPGDSALLYSVQLFNVAFVQFDMGYGAAMAWILTVMILILSLLSFRLARRYVHYEQ